MDRGTWQAAVHGVAKELDSTEHAHRHPDLNPCYLKFISSDQDTTPSYLEHNGFAGIFSFPLQLIYIIASLILTPHSLLLIS